MHVYDKPKKPAGAVGTEYRRKRPKDNIDLDMEDAERLGYGCQYGRYKADHPYTKEAHADQLYPKKKSEAEQAPKVRKVYEKVCPVCGKKFTTFNMNRIYDDDRCKQKNDDRKYRDAHPSK